MSAASTTPTLTTLPERAFSLHCSGLRSPAIAQQLGVPERTVRHWIAHLRDEIAAENTALLRDEFIRAVEHLHQLSAAAWAAFEDEQAAAHPPTTDPSTAPQISIPRHGPRYLRLTLDAQRHLSRLFGHFDHLRATLLDPTSAPAPSLAPTLASPSAAHTETAIPAKTAMPSIGAIEIPAKTATDVTANLRIPVESATASDSPLPAGERARPQPLSGGQPLGERPTGSGSNRKFRQKRQAPVTA